MRKITRLLEARYGIPCRRAEGDPLDVLVETILSQNTNDRNRDRAFETLRERFPRWEDVLDGKVRDVVRAIRTGGLAEQKAKRIRGILRWIRRQYSVLSLDPLREQDSEEVRKGLGGLKGVGPKTVHCLLLFGLGRDAFPVDTHVHRVGRRLGFIPEKLTAEKAHAWMAPLVPEGKALSLHLNLIRFGRSVCKATAPQCSGCFLKKECVSVSSFERWPLRGCVRLKI